MSEAILARIAEGDSAATKECIDRYGGAVWALATRLSPTRADAEDATQEIYLDVYRSAARFDPGKGSELGFVMTIARRRLIDRIRRTKARPQTESVSAEGANYNLTSTELPPETGAYAAEAVRALETLPADQRRIIAMSVYEGLTHREIAERTGRPLGTVKTLIRRGLIQVRKVLTGGDESAGGSL